MAAETTPSMPDGVMAEGEVTAAAVASSRDGELMGIGDTAASPPGISVAPTVLPEGAASKEAKVLLLLPVPPESITTGARCLYRETISRSASAAAGLLSGKRESRESNSSFTSGASGARVAADRAYNTALPAAPAAAAASAGGCRVGMDPGVESAGEEEGSALRAEGGGRGGGSRMGGRRDPGPGGSVMKRRAPPLPAEGGGACVGGNGARGGGGASRTASTAAAAAWPAARSRCCSASVMTVATVCCRSIVATCVDMRCAAPTEGGEGEGQR